MPLDQKFTLEPSEEEKKRDISPNNSSNSRLNELLAEKERRKNLSRSRLNELLAEKERRKNLSSSVNESPHEEEGFWDKTKRSASQLARNSIAGPLDTIDFLATPVREGLNLGAKALGSDYRFKPLGDQTAKAIDTLTGGYTAPRTPGEKTSEAMQRAITGLPMGGGIGALLKGARHLPNGLRVLGEFLHKSNTLNPSNVATTAATAGAIQSSLNADPNNVGQAVIGGFGAGLATPLVGGILSALTKKGRQSIGSRTGEFFNINPEAVETFEKAGVTPMLADVSKSSIPKTITSKLENMPFSAKPIREAKELQRKQVAEALGQGEYGSNLSKHEAGKLFVKGSKNYQKGRSEHFNKRFSKVEQDIEKLSKSEKDWVNTKNVDNFFEKEIFDKFKDPLQEKLFKESALGKKYILFHEAAQKNNGKLPYYAVKDMLSAIRDKITTFGEIGDVTQGKFKQFASNIEKDILESLEPNFKKLGKESYNNWKEVKKHYAQYAQEDIPKLNEIFKKDKKGATDAFLDLMSNQKKGGEKAKIALQGLSHDDQINLMDSVNKHLGSTSDGTFSPLVWVRKFKALEPESQKILLSPLNKSSQERVNYIVDSIDKIKETLSKANTSATAYHNALGTLGGSLGTAATVAATTGNIIPAGVLGSGLFLQKFGTEKILTNPKFINWMYKGMKAKDFDHFQRNLIRIPKVGNFTKTLNRSVQTFQHDLELSEKEGKEK